MLRDLFSFGGLTCALAVGAIALGGCGDANGPSSDVEDAKSVPPLGPDPQGGPTYYPIVLAHGFDASPTNRWGFNGVAEALRADGHQVHVAMVPPYDSPEVRAASLAAHVDEALAEFGADRVDIVAHSMGGLDARVLASPDGLGYGDRIASITTISSPHRGTAVADVALALLPGSADEAINALASAWGLTYSDLAGDSHLRAALVGLSEGNADAFAASYPDDASVYYQSWAGVSSVAGIPGPKDDDACDGKLLRNGLRADIMDPTLVPMATFVSHGIELRPNDGMATVASAHYGDFRGCVPADHLDEVGQVNDHGMDKHTGFDFIRFYRNLAFDLSAQGY